MASFQLRMQDGLAALHHRQSAPPGIAGDFQMTEKKPKQIRKIHLGIRRKDAGDVAIQLARELMQQSAYAGARIADEKNETSASDYAVAQGCKHFLIMKIVVKGR